MSGHASPSMRRLLTRPSIDPISSPGPKWRSNSMTMSPNYSRKSIRSTRSEPHMLTSSPKPNETDRDTSQLFSTPATDLLLLKRRLRAWDGAHSARRVRMLTVLVGRCAGMPAAHLETEFNGSASLFFARITSWFRLTYRHPKHVVTTQLKALEVFLSATGGSKYVLEFIEGGGHLVLLDMLKISGLKHAHSQALRLLRSISGADAGFQAILSKSPCVDVVIETLWSTVSLATEEEGKRLLVQLGTANRDVLHSIVSRMTTDLVDCGAQFRACFASCLRQLLDKPEAPTVDQFEPYLLLLSSTDFEVQSEGQALLVLLVKKNKRILERVLEVLFEMLGKRVASLEDSFALHVLDCTAAAATKALVLLLNEFPEIRDTVRRAKVHLVIARNLACMTLQLVRTESANILRQLFVDHAIQQDLIVAIGSDLVSTILFEPELIRRGFSKTVRQRLTSIRVN